jgi:UDP-2-acetamido-3-amino-2,3-dideoxy-glucuronate N-acetyltransferase
LIRVNRRGINIPQRETSHGLRRAIPHADGREVLVEASYYVHPSSYVDNPCEIGDGTRIWHFCHIMPHAKIGNGCSLGQNVLVSSHVEIGNNVKIQNNVALYTGAIIEDDVFLGPSCVLTNIVNPRSEIVRRHMYENTIIRKGASVGANATIVCGLTIGRYAFIAAGAVVTKDVPDYALMMGVPARRAGWMSRHGYRLGAPEEGGVMTCPFSGLRYHEAEPGVLVCLDLDESAPLPKAA